MNTEETIIYEYHKRPDLYQNQKKINWNLEEGKYFKDKNEIYTSEIFAEGFDIPKYCQRKFNGITHKFQFSEKINRII